MFWAAWRLGYLGGWAQNAELFSLSVRLFLLIGESHRHGGRLLCEWIVRKARNQHMAGTAVRRRLEGITTREDVNIHLCRAGKNEPPAESSLREESHA